MKKVILSILICLSALNLAKAQGNEFIFTWQIAAPGDELSKIVSKTSFQGWAFEYRYALSKQFTIGGSLGWHVFHQEIEKDTWHFDNLSITSRSWRYTHVVPLSANFHWNPLSNYGSATQVFVGGGLGGNYVNQEVWAGMYTFRHERWGFHAYPEIGIRHVMSDQTALFFSTQFMWIPSSSHQEGDLTYWNFRIGFSFGTHRWE